MYISKNVINTDSVIIEAGGRCGYNGNKGKIVRIERKGTLIIVTRSGMRDKYYHRKTGRPINPIFRGE